MIDGGADRHMVNKLHRLHNVVILKNPVLVECVNCTVPSLIGTHSGSLKIEILSRFNHQYTEITLKDVLYHRYQIYPDI
jgi:hypothetical protein